MDSILKDRFDDNWIPVTESGCWIWVGSANKNGYGQIKVYGKYKSAHRLSHEIYNGKIPEGMCVCHSCDTPLCVNPNHLFAGSHADNMADMANKGRAFKGGNDKERNAGKHNGRARLSDIDVIAIRADTRTQKEIAAEYGVCQSQISMIVNRVHWVHI